MEFPDGFFPLYILTVWPRVEFSKSNLNFTRGTIVGRGHWQARASIEKGTAAAPASGGRRCWSLFFCAYYKNTHYKYITVKKANGAKKGGFGFQIVRIYCEIWQFFVTAIYLDTARVEHLIILFFYGLGDSTHENYLKLLLSNDFKNYQKPSMTIKTINTIKLFKNYVNYWIILYFVDLPIIWSIGVL